MLVTTDCLAQSFTGWHWYILLHWETNSYKCCGICNCWRAGTPFSFRLSSLDNIFKRNLLPTTLILMQGLDPKVIVFKYKKKKHYRRNIGHRQVQPLCFNLCNQIIYQIFCNWNVDVHGLGGSGWELFLRMGEFSYLIFSWGSMKICEFIFFVCVTDFG